MRITAFNGSPRGEQSNSNKLVQAFLNGAEEGGAETENVFLIDKNINYCRGCFSCWFKTPGKCVWKDDMEDLLESYLSSDAICFATPVYTWNMTPILKNFIDRLIPLRCPVAVESEGNYDMMARITRFPDSVVISNCGFPGDNNFETMKEVFRSCNPVLEIYRNSGQLLRSKDEATILRIKEYLECVKDAGREYVKYGKVSDLTKEKLQMELTDAEEYVKMMKI